MLPRFLVIGAMKAGTTTLFEDLRAQPAIFLPEKEVGSLNRTDVTLVQGRARYEELYRRAQPGQVSGDVSATYAKLPESAGVTERASALLGNELRVIYLVRDPVDRVVSHHHHELSRGTIQEGSVDVAVRRLPRLVGYTRYATQIRPWLDVLGPDRVRIVKLEAYSGDRVGVLSSILAFLNVTPTAGGATVDKAHNVGVGLPVAVGRRGKFVRSSAYRRLIRPWMPEKARGISARALLPRTPPRPAPPAPATVDLILDQIEPELHALRNMGLSLPYLWDLEATRRRYGSLYEQATIERY